MDQVDRSTAGEGRDEATIAPVIHVYSTMLDLGGVESLLAIHRRWEPGRDLKPCFRMLFDRRPAPADPLYSNQNFRGWHRLGHVRRKFSEVLAATPDATVLYHQGWWLPFLAPFDRARRRLLYLHGDAGFYGTFLEANRGLVDGILCASPGAIEELGRRCPELAAGRCVSPPLPVEVPPSRYRPPKAKEDGTLVLGYAGRLRFDQKRLDRLPEFLGALRAAGVAFRFELCGEGRDGPVLWRRLRTWPEVRFLGTRRGDDYWRTLASWDAALWFSDSEAGPIGLLEAMAAGTLVFFPRLGESWGDRLVPALDPRCHYPSGDMPALARAVVAVFASPGHELDGLRRKARTLIANHTVEAYMNACVGFYTRIARLPRISAPAIRVPGRMITDWLPLGVATRIGPPVMHRTS